MGIEQIVCGTNARCVWFADGAYHRETFPLAVLSLCPRHVVVKGWLELDDQTRVRNT